MDKEFEKVMEAYGKIQESYGIFQCSVESGKSRHDIYSTLETHAIDLHEKINDFHKKHKDYLFYVNDRLSEIENTIIPYIPDEIYRKKLARNLEDIFEKTLVPNKNYKGKKE